MRREPAIKKNPEECSTLNTLQRDFSLARDQYQQHRSCACRLPSALCGIETGVTEARRCKCRAWVACCRDLTRSWSTFWNGKERLFLPPVATGSWYQKSDQSDKCSKFKTNGCASRAEARGQEVEAPLDDAVCKARYVLGTCAQGQDLGKQVRYAGGSGTAVFDPGSCGETTRN